MAAPEIELDEDEQRVFQAVTEVETERGAGHIDEVAGRAGMTADETRAVMSRLLNEHNLVQELQESRPDEPDFGPRYGVR